MWHTKTLHGECARMSKYSHGSEDVRTGENSRENDDRTKLDILTFCSLKTHLKMHSCFCCHGRVTWSRDVHVDVEKLHRVPKGDDFKELGECD